MRRRLPWIAATALLLSGCAVEPEAPADYPLVSLPPARILLDGRLNEPEWLQAACLSDFIFPWEERAAPRTEFRAFAAAGYLYGAFLAEDADLVIEDEWQGERTLDRQDRVEIFLCGDDSLDPYYCLEMDPLGRVHDYRARFHRQFDPAWNWPGLEVGGATTETGYIVEFRIPMPELRGLGLPDPESGETLRMGLFRAEFSRTAEGGMREGWMSWMRPDGETPDFHIPSAFGRLVPQ